jgi:hypothetical protein
MKESTMVEVKETTKTNNDFGFSPGPPTYKILVLTAGSRDSAVGIATGYGLDDRGIGVRVLVGSRIFSSPHRPDQFWGLPSFVSNGYGGGGSFRGVKAAGA